MNGVEKEGGKLEDKEKVCDICQQAVVIKTKGGKLFIKSGSAILCPDCATKIIPLVKKVYKSTIIDKIKKNMGW